MGVNSNIFIVASDRFVLPTGTEPEHITDLIKQTLVDIGCRSEALVKIATKHEAHSALVADMLMLPHPASFFDFAISVAVIHHLSTVPRRVQAIAAILETLKPYPPSRTSSKALIYVWALEQKHSRRGWSEDDEQDVMVPWVMKEKSAESKEPSTKTFHRYYHLYRSGELQRDISAAGGTVIEAGYEKDNWWAIAIRNVDSSIHG